MDDSLVYRYRTEDGLIGSEGTFCMRSFWLGGFRAGAHFSNQAGEHLSSGSYRMFEKSCQCQVHRTW